jgi:tetratricopeptide (TPR) repeat protein
MICSAVMSLTAAPQQPIEPAEYAALVQTYHSGDAQAAAEKLGHFDGRRTEAAFRVFIANPPAHLVTAAAALHTEAALRSTSRAVMDQHLALAASIVEAGEAGKIRRHGEALKLSLVQTVTPQFRRAWHILVITAMQSAGRIEAADSYLESARALFPHDADVLLLSAITDEMRVSPRLATPKPAGRLAALEHAEASLRESIVLAPDRLETRLRLGRVLQQRGLAAAARDVLTPLGAADDARVSYLASLFLGGIEDEAGNLESAAQWYRHATERVPSAQSARIGASELQHRAGQRDQAAADIRSAIAATKVGDPWWTYQFGEYWRIDVYLGAIRGMARV